MGDLIRLGVIVEVDRAAARCVVAVGDLRTGPLPWLAGRAGATSTWSAPTVGEQVLLLCPEGDVAQGVVLPGVYSDANAAPASDGRDLVSFEDGATVAYDPGAHAMTVELPAGGKLTVVAPGGVTIQGDVEVTGDIKAGGDVKAGSVSLKAHKHTGVTAGGALSGAPL